MTNFTDTVTIQGNLGVSVNSSATVPGAQLQVGDLASTSSEGRVRLVSKYDQGNRSWELGTSPGAGYEWGFAVRDVTPGTPLDRLHIAYQTGNVGVGVVNAPEKLTVAGGNVQLSDTGNAVARSILGHFTLAPNTANTTSNLMVGIRNQNSPNYGASVRFAYEGTTGAPGAENTDSHIAFWTMKNGADGGAERMRIASTGFVGIGTTTPGARLQVGDTAGPDAPGTVRMASKYGGGNRLWEIGTDGSPSGWGYGFAIRDLGAAATRFVIDLNGKVGIGEPNPPVMLQVVNQSIDGTRGLLRLASYVEGAGSRTWELGPAEEAGMYFGIRDVIGQGAGLKLVIQNDTGNVGIGVTPPTAKLHVKGPASGQGYTGRIEGDLQVQGVLDVTGNIQGAKVYGAVYG